MSLRSLAGAAACVAVAPAILLGGCGGGSSEKLQALKDDPLARYEPAGAHLVEARGEKEGSTLGKPVYASYRRLFELPAGDPERQLRDALAAATAAGWQLEGSPFRSGGNVSQGASKRLPTGGADLSVTVFPDGTPSGSAHGPALLILMRNLG